MLGYNGQRGAALVETAIITIYLLLLMFVGLEIGMIGYYQLAIDQASQFQARFTALGNNISSTNSVLHEFLPNMNRVDMTVAPTQSSAMKVRMNGTDFNYAQTQARTGGASVIVPFPNISTMSLNKGLLGLGIFPVSISSVAVESSVQELCPHYCLVSGGLSGATSADKVDYFQSGENTMPYFIGYNFMKTCQTNAHDSFEKEPSWDTCPNGQLYWRALGTAAHLDTSNNYYTGNGEDLDPSYSGNISYLPPSSTTGPFFEVWCHRNIYAAVAAIGFPGTTVPVLTPSSGYVFIYNVWDFGLGTEGPGKIIYSQGHNTPANAGWDSLLSPDFLPTLQATNAGGSPLSPWWGCGMPMGNL
jgi:hypothetical protein